MDRLGIMQNKLGTHGNDYITGGGKGGPVEPKRFPEYSLDPVTTHRPSQFSVHAYTQPVTVLTVRQINHSKSIATHPFPPPVHLFKLPRLFQDCVPGEFKLLHDALRRQTFTSLSASCLDNRLSGFGAHPRQEAMGSFSFQNAWLKRSFTHVRFLFTVRRSDPSPPPDNVRPCLR